MSGPDMSKYPEPSAPCHPPAMYGPLPMFGSALPPAYGQLPENPQYQGSYVPYNVGYPQYNVPGQNVVVTSQPTVIVAPLQVYENDYLGYSIFNMLCCCLCFGIGALVYSIKTRDANARGDAVVARSHSNTARVLNHIGLAIGLAIGVAWISYVIYINTAVASYYYNNNHHNNDDFEFNVSG